MDIEMVIFILLHKIQESQDVTYFGHICFLAKTALSLKEGMDISV